MLETKFPTIYKGKQIFPCVNGWASYFNTNLSRDACAIA